MRKFRPHPNPPLLSESKGGGNNRKALMMECQCIWEMTWSRLDSFGE